MLQYVGYTKGLKVSLAFFSLIVAYFTCIKFGAHNENYC